MSTYKLDPALRAELNRKSNWRGALEVAKDWALVFAGFGISALRYKEDGDDETVEEKPGHGIVATTFLLIFMLNPA